MDTSTSFLEKVLKDFEKDETKSYDLAFNNYLNIYPDSIKTVSVFDWFDIYIFLSTREPDSGFYQLAWIKMNYSKSIWFWVYVHIHSSQYPGVLLFAENKIERLLSQSLTLGYMFFKVMTSDEIMDFEDDNGEVRSLYIPEKTKTSLIRILGNQQQYSVSFS